MAKSPTIKMEKFDEIQINTMKTLLNSAIDKSELNRYYLFTQNTIEKSRVFSFCNRFLITLKNLVEDEKLQTQIQKIITDANEVANNILINLNKYETGGSLRQSYALEELFKLVHNEKVNDIIDLFSLLTGKVSYLQRSKIKGVIAEGKSGEKVKEIFKEV